MWASWLCLFILPQARVPDQFSPCPCPTHAHYSPRALREYPDFYRKLYSLLDPSVFHVKYRARFFHLADLFLSSS